jgi:hypothetical protein
MIMISARWFLAAMLMAGCGNDVSLGGPGTLVRVDSEPAGANCADGGVAIHTGLDTNDNAYLDDDEITSTQYVCNGIRPVQCGGGTILTGTVAIASDAELAELDGVNCVDGDLLITGIAASSLPTLALSTVTGDIVVAGNQALRSLAGLGNLREVGDAYLVQGNDSLVDLGPLALLRRADSISIVGNDGLVDLHGFEPLLTLASNLTIANNASLTSLRGLDNLTTSARSMFIRSNPKLVTIDALYQLRSIPLLEVSGNGALTGIGLAALESVAVRLLVNSNASLSVASFPSLKTIGDFARFDSNGALAVIDASALLTTGGLYLTNDPSLTTLYANALVFATAGVDLIALPALNWIDLTRLSSIGGTLNVKSVPNVGTLSGLGALETVGGALVLDRADGLANFAGLDRLTTVSGDMTVSNNARLTSFSGLGNMTEIGGALTISNNPMLPAGTTNAFVSRITVHGKVTVN